MDRPAKVTAQVAPYLAAIRQARAGGWGWREIAERVAPGATPDSVRAAVKACKYEVEQMPLPEKVPAQQQQNARVQQTPAQPVSGVNRPLPGASTLPPGATRQTADVTELERLGVKVHN